jgi:hypothetical protein
MPRGITQAASGMLTVTLLSAWALGQQAVAVSGVGPRTGNSLNGVSFQLREEDSYELPLGADPDNRLLLPFTRHLVADQEHFWTLPKRARKKDLEWLIPAAGATATLFASDSWISKQVPDRPNQLNQSLRISDYTFYSMVAAGGGAFIFGKFSNNDHLREAGLLAGEAAINATAVTYTLKMSTQRARPYQSSGAGDFFAGGSSFPSEHSAAAWSIASVVAHEYPGPLTKFAAYGLASAVTITRVTARQHFPSDVLIGGALGWYFGHQVYRAHHDPELGGAAWGNYFEGYDEPRQRGPDNMGSPYVPPDSWVYPLFDHLVALGFIVSAHLDIRPWTRMECARLLEEAGGRIRYEGVDGNGGEGMQMYRELSREFNPELARINGAANVGVTLDSVYVRGTQISGTPVADGYHFAETIANDYGRPFSSGFNNIAGFTGHAVAGPLSFAVQGEYQHSPAVPGYSPSVQKAIAAADFTPTSPGGMAEVNRVRLLESTVAVTAKNVQLSFGNQSQWWGPSEAGPLLLSDNAAPFPMLKLDSVSPYQVPGLSKLLGSVRTELFIGRLSGHHWEFCAAASCAASVDSQGVVGPNIDPQPFIHGEKISFKPTQNLEFGFGVTATFGGPGLPVTFSNFFRTLYVHSSTPANNPGKRFSAFDFTYRVPGLRNWVTLYSDSLVVDELTPIGSSRPTINPGIYLPQIPKIHRLELRAELLRTAHTPEFPPGFVYFDFRRYRSGYTNDGNLLASWIGRSGRGGEAWATYWLSPRTKLQLGYRLQMVYKDFIEGGRLTDYFVHGDYKLGNSLALSGLFQYEQWWFPILSSTKQSNQTASLELTFYPHWQFRK